MSAAHVGAPTLVGVVGCGYVADYYLRTMQRHCELAIAGVTDLDPERIERVARRHGLHGYESLERLIGDDRVSIVVNLTDPHSHHEVTRRALLAGKHVYSEKPLATSLCEAADLVELAARNDLRLSSAPCSLLGETAQTIWRALRDHTVGTVRVVYAEMDEGLVHRMSFGSWVSESGAPWPHRHEFEIGTVVEHAGYVLSWLPAFFGPATSVTGFSDCLIADKAGVTTDGTDFAVGVVHFRSGVVARVTCSLVAPHDHSLRIVGDRGVLSTRDTWHYDSPVHLRRSVNVGPRHQWLPRRRLRLLGRTRRHQARGTQQMDFGRGVADLATALRVGRRPHLDADFGLHVTELVLALDRALRTSCRYEMTTDFAPLEPMPWAT